MGLKRQVQNEIDRCLKRVAEAQADFQELWLKLEQMEKAPKTVKLDVPAPQYSHACNKDAAAREKLLSELKKHLKRMQRLREQVRSWLMSPETKDAHGLPEARRSIEIDMERFKVCEKQNKTKAYSKVGLQREEKIDPAEIAREDTTEWLNSIVAKLEAQVEENEAEIEEIAAGEGGRTKKSSNISPRTEELMIFIERHKAHIVRLEQVLRLVGNEQVAPAEVEESLRDGLEYYLESSMEPDFQQDDDDLFASIPLLSEVDENIGKIVTPTADRNRSPTAGPAESTEEPPSPQTASTPRSDPKPIRQTKSGKRATRAAAAADAGDARRSRTTPSSPKTPPQYMSHIVAGSTPSTGESCTPPRKGGAWGSASLLTPVRPVAQSSAVPMSESTTHSNPTVSSPNQGHDGQHKTPSLDTTSLSLPLKPQQVPDEAVVGELQRTLQLQQQQQQQQQQQSVASAIAAQPLMSKACLQAFRQSEALPSLHPNVSSQQQYSSEKNTTLDAVLPRRTSPAESSDVQSTWSNSNIGNCQQPQPLNQQVHTAEKVQDPATSSPGVIDHLQSPSRGSPQRPYQWGSDTSRPSVPRLLTSIPMSGVQQSGQQVDDVLLQPSPRAAPVLSLRSLPSLPARAGGSTPSSSSSDAIAAPLQPVLSNTTSRGSAAITAEVEGWTRSRLAAEGDPLQSSRQASSHQNLDPEIKVQSPVTCNPGATLPACPAELRSDILVLLNASMRFGPTSCDADWQTEQPDRTASPVLRPPKVLQLPLGGHSSRDALLLPNAILPELREAATFRRLSEDTLFFAFYFQQGLVQQLYAAEELRRRGFVLHRELNIWFDNPSQLLKSEQRSEQRPIAYFDFELRRSTDGGQLSGWTKRATHPNFEFHQEQACRGYS